jgi:hypothetical protein
MSNDVHTVFVVPRLNSASVAGGACCPVPAEALIVPELEALPGVREASADWQSAEVRVRHSSIVEPRQMAELLDDLSYPAESWNSQPLDGVDKW